MAYKTNCWQLTYLFRGTAKTIEITAFSFEIANKLARYELNNQPWRLQRIQFRRGLQGPYQDLEFEAALDL